MFPPRLILHPSRLIGSILAAFALAFLIPTVLSGKLWPAGPHADPMLTLVTSLLLWWALHVNTTRVVYNGDTLELYFWLVWRRSYVRISRLKRVEQYTQAVLGPTTFIRLEDEDGNIVHFVSDTFSTKAMAQLGATLQKAVAATPSGHKKHFVVLDYIQNKYRNLE